MTASPEDEDDLTWIPRVVRAKLDLAGIRIHLADWQRMHMAERRELIAMPCETADEIAAFRRRVLELAGPRT
jgi:hypothetical protein